MTDPFDLQLAHLVKLAREPGWKQYAWHRAKELEAEVSGRWAGMSTRLREAMASLPPPSSSEVTESSPPR